MPDRVEILSLEGIQAYNSRMASRTKINDALYLAAGYSVERQGDFEIKPLAEVERLYIEMVISLCDGNIPKAAELLQVSPSTIYRKKQQWEQDDARPPGGL